MNKEKKSLLPMCHLRLSRETLEMIRALKCAGDTNADIIARAIEREYNATFGGNLTTPEKP